jgi:hypothetical protein
VGGSQPGSAHQASDLLQRAGQSRRVARELHRGGVGEKFALLSQPARGASWAARLKRAYLRFEGQCVRHGASWPLGRTIVAICRR